MVINETEKGGKTLDQDTGCHLSQNVQSIGICHKMCIFTVRLQLEASDYIMSSSYQMSLNTLIPIFRKKIWVRRNLGLSVNRIVRYCDFA